MVAEFIPPGYSGILSAVSKTGTIVPNNLNLARLFVPGSPAESGIERAPKAAMSCT
jgi:hypothetical protein